MKGKARSTKILHTIFLTVFLITSPKIILAQENPEALEGEEQIIEVIGCGLSYREGRPSISKSKNISHLSLVQQLDDYLVVLRDDTLFSILLNTETEQPLEILSKQKVFGYPSSTDAYHRGVAAYEDIAIVVTDTNEGTDLNFYVLQSNGELEFTDRYSFTYDYEMYTMAIVDGVLVATVYTSTLENATAKSQIETPYLMQHKQADADATIVDIALTQQWVNAFNVAEYDESFSSVLACPLDGLSTQGFKCDVTNLFGVYPDSNFISDSAVYLWGNHYEGGDYGVMAHSAADYLDRTDLKSKVTESEEYKALYRIGIDYADVGAVLVQGRLINPASFEELSGALSALVRKSDIADISEDLYAVNFDLDYFSSLPIPLPESAYHYMASSEGRVITNQFSDKYVVVSLDAYGDKKSQLLIWNIDDESLTAIEKENSSNVLYLDQDTLMTVGYRESFLALEAWSLSEDIENLYTLDSKFHVDKDWIDVFPLTDGDQKPLLAVTNLRMNESADGPAQYIDSYGDTQNINDMSFFDLSELDDIANVGKLVFQPEAFETDCEVSCGEWYHPTYSFRIDDSLYSIIGDEVVKGQYMQGEVSLISRLNLLEGNTEDE